MMDAAPYFFLTCLLCAGVGWLVLRRQKRKQDKKPASIEESNPVLDSALLLELAAAMLRAGQSLAETVYELACLADEETQKDSLLEVSRGLSHGLPWAAAWQRAELVLGREAPASLVALQNCLENLADTGSPTAHLLDSAAERERRLASRQAEKAAAKLSVKLVVPLGLCSLPAFICWGIVPVMIALLPGLTGT